VSEHDGFGPLTPSSGITEELTSVIHLPTSGSVPFADLASTMLDAAQHFQTNLDEAPQAITAFRQAAQVMRDLMFEASRLAEMSCPPGEDGVSRHAAGEIGRWAFSAEPGSLWWALESGSVQMEQAADTLEQSLATYQNVEDVNTTHLTTHLRRSQW
jgi:hypothetical protein